MLKFPIRDSYGFYIKNKMDILQQCNHNWKQMKTKETQISAYKRRPRIKKKKTTTRVVCSRVLLLAVCEEWAVSDSASFFCFSLPPRLGCHINGLAGFPLTPHFPAVWNPPPSWQQRLWVNQEEGEFAMQSLGCLVLEGALHTMSKWMPLGWGLHYPVFTVQQRRKDRTFPGQFWWELSLLLEKAKLYRPVALDGTV